MPVPLLACGRLAVLLEDVGDLGTGREDEAQTALEEDTLDDLDHLGTIRRPVEVRLGVGETVVGEERVDTEVAGVIRHLVDCVCVSRGTLNAPVL